MFQILSLRSVIILNYIIFILFALPAHAELSTLKLCPALSNWETYKDDETKDYALLIPGKDGWLFRSRLDLKFRFKLTERTKDSFRRLNDAFNHNNTHLVITMMPTRGITEKGKLLLQEDERDKLNTANKNYLNMIKELKTTGIAVADMSDVNTVDDYFLKDDNHWTAKGAKFTAIRTAATVKQLPVYDSLRKIKFDTVLTKKEARPPHRYIDFVNTICGTNYQGEDLSEFNETFAEETANSEDALFSDAATPEVVLLGTSNSTHPQPSYANFAGFLKEYLQTDILNEAVSGGSLQGSISNYLLSGNYSKTKPKVIIWEINAYYGYNRQDFLREVVPSVYGECSDKDALEMSEGDIQDMKTELFHDLSDKKYLSHQYYLVLRLDDKSQRNVKVRFIHGGKGDTVKMERPLRSFPENPGIFFAELNDEMESPLDSVILDLKKGSGSFKAKICKTPENAASKALAHSEKPSEEKSQRAPNPLVEFIRSIRKTLAELNPVSLYQIEKTKSPFKVVRPSLPDISIYTKEAILDKIPPLKRGQIEINNMEGEPPLRKFAFDKRLVEFQNIQNRVEPLAIHIRSGVYNFTDVVKELQNTGFIKETDDAYILRTPLAIYPEASLIINKLSKPLLMSQEKGAFIVSAGNLFILDTTIIGWNEENKRSAELNEKFNNFRPFITTWDGSKLYIANSTLQNLGYALSKSYGITVSTNDVVQEEFEARYGDLPAPTGWIIDSSFEGLYFGFYSYEASNFVILRNTYRNNVIYGIDPHDRSERLIIAYNKVYGSGKKHGIILSREVNDSFVFNNDVSHNKGSGIMLDRNCQNTVVAGNVLSKNKGDGITIYESPNNILYDNEVLQNEGSGIRIRNSWNVQIIGGKNKLNKKYAFTIYQDPLTSTHRDFEMDPVTTRSSAVVSHMQLENNGGIIKSGGFESVRLENIDLQNASMKMPLFSGDLQAAEEKIQKHLKEFSSVEIH